VKKARVGILSLGCPRNLVDSETLAAGLAHKGFSIVDINDADIAIINTCAFVNDAKSESIDAILDLIEAKKKGRIRKIIVYGCFAQRYKHILPSQLPEVDAFVGRIGLSETASRFALVPSHFAYLKICEGCVNQCSFCIIPRIKGKFQSLPSEAILQKVRQLDKQKISELNIIGQDITAYGRDLGKGQDLVVLLKKILKCSPSIGWFRLLYLYPSRVSEDLLRLMRDEPRICKYLDVPIQHTSDRILKLMNRATTKKRIINLMQSIRRIVPNVAIRTTLITGFPSETDKEFKEMAAFIKEMEFERLGVFMYSREEQTLAFDLPGQVPYKVKEARFNRLMSVQQEVSKSINSRYMGETVDVLIEESRGKGMYAGRSQHDAPDVDGTVFVRSKSLLKPGEFVKVKISDTMEYDLAGETIK
jgi:ribosomal protein S12 methylthiotransferase